MTLEEWRISNNYSYEELARKLKMTTSKAYRICNNPNCTKLTDAAIIVRVTKAQVSYDDLLQLGRPV